MQPGHATQLSSLRKVPINGLYVSNMCIQIFQCVYIYIYTKENIHGKETSFIEVLHMEKLVKIEQNPMYNHRHIDSIDM